MDLCRDTTAIMNSVVSNSYYGMLRGQIHTKLPPEHPIKAIGNNGIQNGCYIAEKVHSGLKGIQTHDPVIQQTFSDSVYVFSLL